MNTKKILGVVAEYDPFHNGHVRHLSESRKAVNPDAVYVVLSPCLKQRGTLSLLSPYDRAACAVHEGADAVFSLPVLWTIRSAEDYALGSVSLLAGLGITHLAFGAETADPELLSHTAALLEDPPPLLTETLHTLLMEGLGYPAALSRAAAACLPDAGDILSRPNNILAVSYLRAIRRLCVDIHPVIIPRTGNYHDDIIDPEAPSASALRNGIRRGLFQQAFSAMPSFSAGILYRRFLDRHFPIPEKWNLLVSERLRLMDSLSSFDDPEGLLSVLRKNASSGMDPATIASRRYPASRVSRLCALAVLNVSSRRLESLSLPSVTLLLALRKKTALTDGWKDLPVHICSSVMDWKEAADPEDLLSWKLWALCCGLPDTLPFTEKMYTE